MLDLFNLIFDGIVNILQAILPVSQGLPQNIHSGINFIVGRLFSFNFILPVPDIILILQYTIAFEIAVVSFKFVKMVINFLRGSGA